jgi:hypothetical protein
MGAAAVNKATSSGQAVIGIYRLLVFSSKVLIVYTRTSYSLTAEAPRTQTLLIRYMLKVLPCAYRASYRFFYRFWTRNPFGTTCDAVLG